MCASMWASVCIKSSPKPVDALRQFACKLLIGGGERQFRARMNQISHGLRLCQVYAAV